jgi:hypothetical protein
MSDESSADICVDELDAEINVEEVTHAINCLKWKQGQHNFVFWGANIIVYI